MKFTTTLTEPKFTQDTEILKAIYTYLPNLERYLANNNLSNFFTAYQEFTKFVALYLSTLNPNFINTNQIYIAWKLHLFIRSLFSYFDKDPRKTTIGQKIYEIYLHAKMFLGDRTQNENPDANLIERSLHLDLYILKKYLESMNRLNILKKKFRRKNTGQI